MKMMLDLINSLFFGFGFPVLMMLAGRAMISNRDGERSRLCFGIPAAGKSKKNQGLVNGYGGHATIRWSKAALVLAATFLLVAILIPLNPTVRMWLFHFAVPMSSLLTIGSILETAIWARNLPRSEQGEEAKASPRIS
jgi:hypothetical protein